MLIEPGRVLGHYKIVELLGKGGMGEVYLAEDLKLRRQVAVKTLLPELADDVEWSTRFRHEARAVAALNHPNVVTLYSFDEIDGVHFLTLEFIEGTTLKRWVPETGLDPAQMLDVARALASGLAAAHAKGIVHRDLKPTNVMVTHEDRIKILDFGLAVAKMLQLEELDDKVTVTMSGSSAGTIAGTLHYIAPEIFKGREANEASDIFALGVILYELATGRRPFQSSNPLDHMAAVLRDVPPPVAELNPGLSRAFAETIDRCLLRDPADRPASCLELRDLLRSLDAVDEPSTGPGITGRETAGRPAIVVLPFDLVPPQGSDGHLSEGLTDEIIADLSKLGSLRVLAKSSAAQVKSAPETLKELSRSKNVRYVLEGTVRKLDQRIRVSARLSEVESQEVLWADRYSGDLAEIFDIEESISRTVVDALQLKVTRDENARMIERPIPDIRAYEYYLRAKGEITRFREDSLEKVVHYLGKGLEIMGQDNILLNSALGYAYWQYFNAGISTDRSFLDKAQACASRILAQDPSSAHGHRLLGLLSGHQKDLPRMVQHLKHALADDPNDTDALFWLSLMYGFVGRPERGMPLADRLLEIDPLTPFYNVLPGWLALLDGRFAEAPERLADAYAMDRGNPMLGYCYGHGLVLGGRRDEAVEVFAAVAGSMPEDFHAGLVTFFTHALAGDREAALSTLAGFEEAASKDFQYSWNVAEYLAALGEEDKALDWLQNTIDLGFIGYRLFAEQDPLLSGLRATPRFGALMDRLRPAWESFQE